MHGTLSAMDEPPIPANGAATHRVRLLDRRPTRRTLAAIAIGLVGVLVSETAAGLAPVALPLLVATGILGATVRPGWGGPGFTWVGGVLAEGGTAVLYVLTHAADAASQDSLSALVLLAGVVVVEGAALFSGLFFAGFVVVEGARRFLPPRWAERAIMASIVVLLAASAYIFAASTYILATTP